MPHPENAPKYCCTPRRKFLIGLVAVDHSVELTAQDADLVDFERTDSECLVIQIRYCPFCGKPPGTTRTPKEIQ
jgi:hypothetical protein